MDFLPYIKIRVKLKFFVLNHNLLCINVVCPDSKCVGCMRMLDTIACVWIHLPVCNTQRD